VAVSTTEILPAWTRGRGAGEDLREDGADRRALSVNDGGGAGNGNRPLAHKIGAGGTAALG
jgi:hypothetical protein